MKYLISIYFIVTTSLCCTDVFASYDPCDCGPNSGEVQEWWQGILVFVLKAMVTIFTPVISLMIVSLLKKHKIRVELETIDKIVTRATGYAEQQMKIAFKDGRPMKGHEGLQLALEMAETLADGYGITKKIRNNLVDSIEAKLGENELAKKTIVKD